MFVRVESRVVCGGKRQKCISPDQLHAIVQNVFIYLKVCHVISLQAFGC